MSKLPRAARLEAALLELHGPPPGPLCRCVNCNDFKPCPGQALSGDDSALKAMLDAAREEGKQSMLCPRKAHQPYDALECPVCLAQERDSLRARLAEAQRERDEQRRRYKDELAALHDTRRDRERLLDLATAQVERLRSALTPFTTLPSQWITWEHVDVCQLALSSLKAFIDSANSVLVETPEQSIAAVREQARRDGLEDAADKIPRGLFDGANKFEHHRSATCWLRDLAAQPAKEPQS